MGEKKGNCVRCGRVLCEERKLRCKDCMELVMEELSGKANRPFRYYFRWNLKHRC